MDISELFKEASAKAVDDIKVASAQEEWGFLDKTWWHWLGGMLHFLALLISEVIYYGSAIWVGTQFGLGDEARGGDETMKVGTVLIAVAIAGVSLPVLGQTNDNSRALADCLQAADQKYKDTWKGLCGQDGKGFRYCNEFIGSPRDREFSQLRIEEMTLCSKLHGR